MARKNKRTLATAPPPSDSTTIPKNQPHFGQQNVHLHQFHRVQTIFDPEVVRKYGEIVPGAPERILTIFEKNNETERVLREKQAESQIEIHRLQAKDNRRRHWMAFLLVATSLLVSAFFAYLQLAWLSASTLLGIAVAVMHGFLSNKRPKIASKGNTTNNALDN